MIINKKINEDIINSFSKNIIFKEEKIVNNNYYKNKINFDNNAILNLSGVTNYLL